MNIVQTIVDALTSMLTGSVSAITEGFNTLFFVNGENGQELSTLGTFMLIFVGIGCAIGLVYVVLNLFRKKQQKQGNFFLDVTLLNFLKKGVKNEKNYT